MATSKEQNSSGWFLFVLFAAFWQFTLPNFVSKLIRSGGREPKTKRIQILHLIMVLFSIPFLVSAVITSQESDSNILTTILVLLFMNAFLLIPVVFWYLVFWGLLRQKTPNAPLKKEKPPAPPRPTKVVKPEKVGPVKVTKPEKVGTAKVSAPTLAENAARRIREISTSYDNPAMMVNFEGDVLDAFFVMMNIRVTRSTQNQSISGPGALVICRTRVYVKYYNERSRQPQWKVLQKPWSQTAGVTPNSFDLYFKDLSSFEFKPVNAEDHLVLSAFWQVFNFAMNGYHELLSNPEESGLGNRLRTVAKYIEEHPAECANGALDVVAALGEEEIVAVEPINEAFHKPKAGDVIDGFTLTKALGAGGFGTVFLAEVKEDPTHKVAIKLMNPAKGIKPGSAEFFNQAESFTDEASRAINFADDAYVLSAQDCGMKPWPWIRYPYLSGQTVLDRVKLRNMTVQQWWDLAHDLLSGLDCIHSEGLVHKDIKPDNIMMIEDRSIILDLGIAAVSGYEEFSHTTWNTMLLSPELLASSVKKQLTGSSFTPKSDIFAAGMTLYFCVKGHMPWPNTQPGMTNEARLDVVQTQPVDFAEMPEDMAALLKEMLQVDPAQRPSAKTLLFQVAPHIDIEAKISQIEGAWKESLDRIDEYEEEHEPKVSGIFTNELKSPFTTWLPLEQEIKRLVNDVRPSKFIVDFYFADRRESIYVQAFYSHGGWILECMSEIFTEVEHSKRQKQQFSRLGWTPPTSSSPNYERNESGIFADDIVNLFITALEQAYGIRPAELATISTTAHDSGAY